MIVKLMICVRAQTQVHSMQSKQEILQVLIRTNVVAHSIYRNKVRRNV